MSLIKANGSRVYPPLFRKRIKDDVTWDKSELSWRRSPFWLILHVSVQRLLCLEVGGERAIALQVLNVWRSRAVAEGLHQQPER